LGQGMAAFGLASASFSSTSMPAIVVCRSLFAPPDSENSGRSQRMMPRRSSARSLFSCHRRRASRLPVVEPMPLRDSLRESNPTRPVQRNGAARDNLLMRHVMIICLHCGYEWRATMYRPEESEQRRRDGQPMGRPFCQRCGSPNAA